jgi:hypothetical protein
VTSVPHTLKGRGVTAGEAEKVGVGTVVGAVAGRVIGGKATGAVVGGAVGAAGGTVVAIQTASRDVVVSAGARWSSRSRDRSRSRQNETTVRRQLIGKHVAVVSRSVTRVGLLEGPHPLILMPPPRLWTRAHARRWAPLHHFPLGGFMRPLTIAGIIVIVFGVFVLVR